MTVYKQFLVTDISGSPVLGGTGFSTYYWNNGANITGSTNTVTEITSGWYNVGVTVEPLGELLLMLKHPTAQVAPDAHTWTKESIYDSDDIYGLVVVATSTTALPVIPSQRYVTTTINTKDNDAITETVQVPARFRPLTSWTDISIQAFPNARTLTASAAPLSGTYSATVINASAGIIDIVIASDVINNLVPSGVSSVQVFADLQGDDPDGYRKTMMEFAITVKRDYNNDT